MNPLTEQEVNRRLNIILPFLEKGETHRSISKITGFSVRVIEKLIYQHRPDLKKYIPVRSHTNEDFDLPTVMPDTGKRCQRCRRMIQKSESYHNVPRGWEHLDTGCRKRKVDTAPRK